MGLSYIFYTSLNSDQIHLLGLRKNDLYYGNNVPCTNYLEAKPGSRDEFNRTIDIVN